MIYNPKSFTRVFKVEGKIMSLFSKGRTFKFYKITALLVLIVSLLVIGWGLGKKDNKAIINVQGSNVLETDEIRYQGWAGQVLLPELAEDLGYLAPLKLKWIGNTISGPQDIQAVASGDIDIGSAFGTAIINLKAANAPIKWVISSGGSDDKVSSQLLVLEDSPIKTARDLIGKKISVNTIAAHNEIVIKQYLRKNGLTEDEIKQVQLIIIPPANAEQTLRQKQVDAAMLGGIFKDKAYERGGIRALTSDVEILGKRATSGTVLSEKFIKRNPNAAKKYVEAIAKTIEWSRETPREQVVARLENIIKKRGRNEDTSAIKYWKGWGVESKGGLVNDKDIQLWIDILVNDGKLKKGQIKTSDVYTNEFNPYK